MLVNTAEMCSTVASGKKRVGYTNSRSPEFRLATLN